MCSAIRLLTVMEGRKHVCDPSWRPIGSSVLLLFIVTQQMFLKHNQETIYRLREREIKRPDRSEHPITLIQSAIKHSFH